MNQQHRGAGSGANIPGFGKTGHYARDTLAAAWYHKPYRNNRSGITSEKDDTVRQTLLAFCVLFLFAGAVSAAAPPRRPAAVVVYTADVIGYVTERQVRAAQQSKGLPVSALDARQRQLLPRSAPATRITFFKKGKGRYGITLIAPPSVEEYKP